MQNSTTKFIYPYFESIRLENGHINLWEWHRKRIHTTILHHHQSIYDFASLNQALTAVPKQGIFKLRIFYNASNFTLEYIPYLRKSIHSLVLKKAHGLEYPYKYCDRAVLYQRMVGVQPDQEVIFTVNDHLTDSSYSNLALFDGIQWYTPTTFLLNGVRRQFLLNEGRLKEAVIKIDDLKNFVKISLINAMLDLDAITLSINDIDTSSNE